VKALGIRIAVLVSLLFTGVPASAAGLPEPKVEYSADSVMETEEATITSKVYQAAGKKRIEQRAAGGRQIMILRQDRQVMWLLMPDERMYMEHALKESDDPEALDIETTVVGPDVVDGRPATKYKTIARRPDGLKLGGFTWITADGIPMKMDLLAIEGSTKTRMKMELKNVATGKLDPGLFEVPAGYRKLALGPGGLPAGIPGIGTPSESAREPATTPSGQQPERERPDAVKELRKKLFGR
jgi:hypothetical protein